MGKDLIANIDWGGITRTAELELAILPGARSGAKIKNQSSQSSV